MISEGLIIENTVQKVVLTHSTLIKRKDGLIIILCSDNHSYTINEIKENYEIIKQLSPGKKAFVLSIAGRYTSVEPETKSFTADGPHKDFIEAEAFVITNLSQRILAKFYFKINRPVVKSDFFTDYKKAEIWMLKQMKKYNKQNEL